MFQVKDLESLCLRILPCLKLLPVSFRPHFVAVCGEFVGTWLFLFFAFMGTQTANSIGEATRETTFLTITYVALSFGFSLAVNAWVFFRISGGLFNPAVTVGMCIVGATSWLRGSLLIVAQILGAVSSAATVSVLCPDDLMVQTDLNTGTSITQGLFIEMFLTAQLAFTIFMLAAEKHRATFIAPIGIGLALFISELAGVHFTGGSLNPARSLAPAVVTRSFPGYHWIYWVGPIMGAILSAGFYKFVKTLEYETANPGQDHDRQDILGLDVEKGRDPRHLRTPASLSNQQHETERPSERQAGKPGIYGGGEEARVGASTSSSPATASGGSMYLALETQPVQRMESKDDTGAELVEHGSLCKQHDSDLRSKSKERPRRKQHMWPEGHHVDAEGHRTWV